VDETRTDPGAGPHYGLKRLIAYREGTLPAAERERVQEHLSLCPRCTGLLRELREFEKAAARGESGPEVPRQEAWDALVRRLPAKTPAIRPVANAVPLEPRPPRRSPRFALGALAALLLLALAGLLFQRERIAGPAPAERDPVVVASQDLEVSVAPRYILRGQEAPDGGVLRGGGAVNPVRTTSGKDRFTVAFELADPPAYEEYRFELLDRGGRTLWSERRPGASVSGDAGTSVTVRGLGPGLYRLRVEGLKAGGGEPVAEYVLRLTASPR
jgi:hypothetical protein